MSTIHDLREALDRHAEDLVDTGLPGRVGAVHQSVRVARRRRAATVAAAAVVALGSTVAVAGLGDGPGATPQPATELGGHVVPAQLTSLGYTYAYAGGVDGAAQASLRLSESDQPRLVSWASSDEVVKLAGPHQEVWTSSATDFEDFTFVPAGDTPTFTAYGEDAALAVYDLTDAAPAGVTRAGVTFRQQVAGRPLLGAAIADSGAAQVSADLDGAAGTGQLSLAVLCTGGGSGVWTHVSLNGVDNASFGPGCTDSTFDPGAVPAIGRAMPPGGAHSVRLWVTDGEDGPLVDDPDIRIGVAAYGPAESSTTAAGLPVPSLLEADGHTWQLLDVRAAARGERQVTVTAPGQDVVATAYVSGMPVMSYASVLRDHRVASRFSAGREVVQQLGILRDGSSPTTVRLGGTLRPDARLAVALYSQLG